MADIVAETSVRALEGRWLCRTAAHEESACVADQRNNHYRSHEVAGLFLCLAICLSPVIALSECLSGLVFQIFNIISQLFQHDCPNVNCAVQRGVTER